MFSFFCFMYYLANETDCVGPPGTSRRETETGGRLRHHRRRRRRRHACGAEEEHRRLQQHPRPARLRPRRRRWSPGPRGGPLKPQGRRCPPPQVHRHQGRPDLPQVRPLLGGPIALPRFHSPSPLFQERAKWPPCPPSAKASTPPVPDVPVKFRAEGLQESSCPRNWCRTRAKASASPCT